MKCNNCGNELKANKKKCSSCGVLVEESSKIQITYEDEETEYVDPPVITEAHTFIDEESFAKKVNKANQEQSIKEKEEMWDEPSHKGPAVGVFIVLILIALGLVGYFVVYPNIISKKQETTIKDFTSKEWSSGEFKIDEDFYQLNSTYTSFYKKNWNFVDEQTLEMSLDPKEETEEYEITNTLNNKKLQIRIRNTKDKEMIIKESEVWSVKLNTKLEENEVDFVLPGDIKNGSKAEEIKKAYGILTEENVIRDDEEKSTTYHYSNDEKKNLDLIVYDDDGLKSFHYYVS